MAGEISPVNAPSSTQHTFCAPNPIAEPASASRAAASAVNGGHSTASTSLSGKSRARTSATNARVCAIVLCIFQLPTISGRRAPLALVLERRDAGQRLALEKLQRRAAAGGHV